MKLKGISKLVLAGTALAATAATLTTATYAWYVTNAKVQATGVQGSVAGAAAGSLFIAQNTYAESKNAPGTYVTKIDLVEAANTGYSQTEGGLDAQSKATVTKEVDSVLHYFVVTSDASYQSGTTYYTLNAGVPTEATGITAFAENTVYYVDAGTSPVWVDKEGKLIITPRLLTFKYWLKSSAAGNAQITLKVDNTTATPNPQKSLSGTGNPSGVTQGQSFTVDAVHALRMQIDKTPYTNDGSAMTAGTKTSTTYQVDASGLGTYTTETSTAKTRTDNPINFVTGGDANQYFYSIMKYVPYGTSSTQGEEGKSTDANTGDKPTTAVNVELEADKDTLLEFTIWLEGSDADCYDSCRGQSFTFDFEYNFTATPANNNNNG